MVLKMSSIADELDTRTHEFSFVVTITEDCSQLFNYPPSTAFAYTIQDPAVEQTFTLNDFSYTHCFFKSELTLDDDSPIDSDVFSYTDVVLIQDEVSLLYDVQTYPSIVVKTSDFAKVGTVYLKITATAFSYDGATFENWVWLSFCLETVNPCVGSLDGIPADNEYDLTYTAHTSAVQINLNGINNGSCTFSLKLLTNYYYGIFYADSAIFTMSQPTWTTAALDPRIISLNTDGNIMISAENYQAGTYQLILEVQSTKQCFDYAVQQSSFVVTILKHPCTQVLTDPTFATSTTYYIKTLQLPTTITFLGLSNTECLFDTSLKLQTGAAFDSTLFTYTPEVLAVDPVIDTIYSVTSTPKLVVSTSDISKEGTYNFKLTVFSRSSSTDAVSKTYDFSVVLIDNPCVGSLAGIPPDYTYDLTYTAHMSPATINLTGINNGSCTFSFQLLNSNSFSADSTIFTTTQPTLTTVVAAIDPRIISVTQEGKISISTVNQKAGTYQLILRVYSTKNALDTAVLDTHFVVTISKYQCTQGLTDPIFDVQTTYYIKTPSVLTTVTFLGISNMNCFFDTTLTLSTGVAFDSTVFTYTPEVLAVDQVINNIYSVTSTPKLEVNTSDVSKEAIYNLKLTVFSRSSAIDSVSKTYDFTVILIDNPCVEDLTADPKYELTYTVGLPSSSLQFNSVKNNDCKFTISLKSIDPVRPANANLITLADVVQVTKPQAIDPRIVQVQTPARLSVWSDNNSDKGTYLFFLSITSLRNQSNQSFIEVPLKINILPSLAVWKAVGEQKLTIFPLTTKLDSILINLNSNPLAQTSITEFSSVPNTPATLSLFSLDYDSNKKEYRLFQKNDLLSIGVFKLKFKVVDVNDISNSADLIYQINVLDFCKQAQVTLIKKVQDFTIKNGDGINETSLATFEVDKDHVKDCGEVVTTYEYDIVGTTPQFDWKSFIDLSKEQNKLAINAGDFTENFEVQFIIKASIQGRSDYSNNQNAFKVSFKTSHTKTEEKQTQSSTEQSSGSNSYASAIVNKLTLQKFKPQEVSLNPITPKPTAKINSISNSGLVEIIFSSPMYVPDFLQDIPEQKKQGQYQDWTTTILQVRVISSGFEPAELMRIANYTIDSYKEYQLMLQVNFENPNFISASILQPDQIEVVFLKEMLFIDQINKKQIDPKLPIFKDLPPQLTQLQAIEAENLQQSSKKTMSVVSGGNIALNFVLSYGLKYLWNMINLLQFLVFIEKWKFNLPYNAKAVLSYLRSLALMEFIDTSPATKWISDKLGMCEACKETRANQKILSQLTNSTNSTDQKHVKRFMQDLEDSQNSTAVEEPKKADNDLIQNLGIVILLFLGICVALIALFGIRSVIYWKYSWARFYFKMKEKIFWNTFIRFVIQSTLKMQIGFVLTLVTLKWTTSGHKMQMIIAAFSLFIATLVLPFFFGVILYRNRENLWRPSVKAKIGSLYLGINTDKFLPLTYVIVFLARRSLFVLVMFTMPNQPAIQMNLFIYMSNLYVIYLFQVYPHDDSSTVTIEAINEMCLMLICYHFILLSDLVTDPVQKYNLGLSLSIILGIMIAGNILFIVYQSLWQVIINCRAKRVIRVRTKHAELIKGLREMTLKKLEEQYLLQMPKESNQSEQSQNSDQYEDRQAALMQQLREVSIRKLEKQYQLQIQDESKQSQQSESSDSNEDREATLIQQLREVTLKKLQKQYLLEGQEEQKESDSNESSDSNEDRSVFEISENLESDAKIFIQQNSSSESQISQPKLLIKAITKQLSQTKTTQRSENQSETLKFGQSRCNENSFRKPVQKISSLGDLVETTPKYSDQDCGWSPRNPQMEANFDDVQPKPLDVINEELPSPLTRNLDQILGKDDRHNLKSLIDSYQRPQMQAQQYSQQPNWEYSNKNLAWRSQTQSETQELSLWPVNNPQRQDISHTQLVLDLNQSEDYHTNNQSTNKRRSINRVIWNGENYQIEYEE